MSGSFPLTRGEAASSAPLLLHNIDGSPHAGKISHLDRVLGNLGEDVTLEGLAEGEGEGNLGDAPVDSLREL